MYDPNLAAKYWGQRISKYDLKTAVLSLSLPKFLNDAYALWETKTLTKELGKTRGKKIVDIGCGGGRNTILLAKMGAKVTGIDISSQMLQYAKKNAKMNSCLQNTEFVVAFAWKTGLPSNSFDKVLLLGILEHLPDKYKKATIKEAKRLLKRNGKIFVVINNKNSFYLKQVLKWKKPRQQNSGYFSSLMDPKKIISFMSSLSLQVKVVNSNLNYSILLHTLDKINPNLITKKDSKQVKLLFEYLINLDLEHVSSKIRPKQYKSLEQKFADQYFLVAKN